MNQVCEFDDKNVRIIQLNHPNKHNPFSKDLEYDIKKSLEKADNDSNIEAIIVTGGKDRSFSSGGDFNEVKNLNGGNEVDEWIDRVIELYKSVLNVKKPTIAAIEGFAIGMGFQFAMMFDYRVMSKDAEFRMPELKHGIGCSIGTTILTTVLNYNVMREIVIGCENINFNDAIKYQLVNKVVNSEELLPTSIETARQLANYPKVPFQDTKRFMVNNLIKALDSSSLESKKIHRTAFKLKTAQNHFEKVLGKKSAPLVCEKVLS